MSETISTVEIQLKSTADVSGVEKMAAAEQALREKTAAGNAGASGAAAETEYNRISREANAKMNGGGANAVDPQIAARQAALESQVAQRQILADLQTEQLEAQAAGDTTHSAALEREIALRTEALKLQRSALLSEEEAFAIAQKRATAQAAIAAEETAGAEAQLFGMTKRAQNELLTVGRELATTGVRARSLSALLGDFGPEFAIAGVAAYAIGDGVYHAYEEIKKAKEQAAEMTEKVKEQGAAWKEVARNITSEGDFEKFQTGIGKSLESAQTQLSQAQCNLGMSDTVGGFWGRLLWGDDFKTAGEIQRDSAQAALDQMRDFARETEKIASESLNSNTPIDARIDATIDRIGALKAAQAGIDQFTNPAKWNVMEGAISQATQALAKLQSTQGKESEAEQAPLKNRIELLKQEAEWATTAAKKEELLAEARALGDHLKPKSPGDQQNQKIDAARELEKELHAGGAIDPTKLNQARQMAGLDALPPNSAMTQQSVQSVVDLLLQGVDSTLKKTKTYTPQEKANGGDETAETQARIDAATKKHEQELAAQKAAAAAAAAQAGQLKATREEAVIRLANPEDILAARGLDKAGETQMSPKMVEGLRSALKDAGQLDAKMSPDMTEAIHSALRNGGQLQGFFRNEAATVNLNDAHKTLQDNAAQAVKNAATQTNQKHEELHQAVQQSGQKTVEGIQKVTQAQHESSAAIEAAFANLYRGQAELTAKIEQLNIHNHIG